MSTANPTGSVAPFHARDTEGKPADFPRRFECPVRLTPNGVAITSPKTGRTVSVPASLAPVRVRSRVIQARSIGRKVAQFTANELRAFLAAVPIPQPIHGGWHRPRNRRSR